MLSTLFYNFFYFFIFFFKNSPLQSVHFPRALFIFFFIITFFLLTVFYLFAKNYPQHKRTHMRIVCTWHICTEDIFVHTYITTYLCIYIFMYLRIYILMYLCIYIFMYNPLARMYLVGSCFLLSFIFYFLIK